MQKVVRPDSKGRITLGHLADGVSSFLISQTDDHRIILEPRAEIPMSDKSVLERKDIREMIERGLKDAREGKLTYRGSFSKYLDDGKCG